MRLFGEHANDSRLARSNPAEDADDHGVFPVRGPRPARLRIPAVPGWSTPTTFDSNAEVPKDTRKKRGLGVILDSRLHFLAPLPAGDARRVREKPFLRVPLRRLLASAVTGEIAVDGKRGRSRLGKTSFRESCPQRVHWGSQVLPRPLGGHPKSLSTEALSQLARPGARLAGKSVCLPLNAGSTLKQPKLPPENRPVDLNMSNRSDPTAFYFATRFC